MADDSQLQLDKLSPLGRWVYSTGVKYEVCNRTLTALNVEPEPDVEYLFGNRYYDLSLALVFALAIPIVRRLLRRFVSQVRHGAAG